MEKNIQIGFAFTVDDRDDMISSVEDFDKKTNDFYLATRAYLNNLSIIFNDVQFSQVVKQVLPPPPPPLEVNRKLTEILELLKQH